MWLGLGQAITIDLSKVYYAKHDRCFRSFSEKCVKTALESSEKCAKIALKSSEKCVFRRIVLLHGATRLYFIFAQPSWMWSSFALNTMPANQLSGSYKWRYSESQLCFSVKSQNRRIRICVFSYVVFFFSSSAWKSATNLFSKNAQKYGNV